MATYVIGDLHGQFDTLMRLLQRVGYDQLHDSIWLVGDLVNRGPQSVEVLRWARQQSKLIAVLGNHDLHLIGRALGVREARPRDVLEDVLDATDRDDLIQWLRQRPLLHRTDTSVVVHAGLFPAWTLDQAQEQARELEQILRGAEAPELLQEFYRPGRVQWSEQLTDVERRRAALKALTVLRTCTVDNELCPEFSGKPQDAPSGCLPWYECGERRWDDGATQVLFGHWSALGHQRHGRVIALDSGAAWELGLTAWRLEDGVSHTEPVLRHGIS